MSAAATTYDWSIASETALAEDEERRQRRAGNNTETVKRCNICASTEHLARACPQRKFNVVCRICGKKGHVARNCFSLKRQREQESALFEKEKARLAATSERVHVSVVSRARDERDASDDNEKESGELHQQQEQQPPRCVVIVKRPRIQPKSNDDKDGEDEPAVGASTKDADANIPSTVETTATPTERTQPPPSALSLLGVDYGSASDSDEGT